MNGALKNSVFNKTADVPPDRPQASPGTRRRLGDSFLSRTLWIVQRNSSLVSGEKPQTGFYSAPLYQDGGRDTYLQIWTNKTN